MTKPHVFFATIAAGGGHVATARAMAEGLETHYPGAFQTTISDYMLELGLSKQDAQHKKSWAWMLTYPWSARYGQRILDTLPRLTNRYHRLFLDEFAKRAAVHLNDLSPALVVANHGWVSVALTRAQRRYGLRVPVLSFATEPLDASALWAEPDAERFAVPSKGALRDLKHFGVPAEKIDLVGYPVQNAFLQALSKKEARAKLALAEHLTCLVSLGGEGVGRSTDKVIEALLQHPLEPQIVVMTGRNQMLKEKLQTLGRVHTVGFTEHMADYLAAADVVVGKAGPASVLEALAVGRGVLVSSYAGLNEAKLVRFLEQKSLGAYVPSPEKLAQKLTEFTSPETQQRVLELSQKLQLGTMTQNFSRYLAEVVIYGFPKTPVRWRGLR